MINLLIQNYLAKVVKNYKPNHFTWENHQIVDILTLLISSAEWQTDGETPTPPVARNEKTSGN